MHEGEEFPECGIGADRLGIAAVYVGMAEEAKTPGLADGIAGRKFDLESHFVFILIHYARKHRAVDVAHSARDEPARRH